MSRQKAKFARTYTVLYDADKKEERQADQQWRLLRDTVRTMDCSLRNLERLFNSFQDAAAGREHSFVSFEAYSEVLTNRGVRDAVFVQRLFDEFCDSDPTVPPRIDFRQLLRILVSVNPEPINERIALLFTLIDADDSGGLAYSELYPHIIHDTPLHKRAVVIENFNRVWTQLRAFSQSENEAVGLGVTSEVSLNNLVGACNKLPAVRNFLQDVFTRKSPKAEETSYRNFHARLRQLDREVRQEINGRNQSKPEAKVPAAAPRLHAPTARQFYSMRKERSPDGKNHVLPVEQAVVSDVRLFRTLEALKRQASMTQMNLPASSTGLRRTPSYNAGSKPPRQ